MQKNELKCYWEDIVLKAKSHTNLLQTHLNKNQQQIRLFF